MDQEILMTLPQDLHLYLCGTQENLGHILSIVGSQRELTLLDPQKTHFEDALDQIDVAFLLYRTPTTDYLQRYRSILSAHIAYFTTAEALQSWWGDSWQTWDPISLQKRLNH